MMVIRIFVLVITIASLLQPVRRASSQGLNAKLIQGAYPFVSETTKTDKPEVNTSSRKFPEWRGIYIFENGVYSASLVSVDRKVAWLPDLPKTLSELGFESTSGTYKISWNILEIEPSIALYPSEYHYTKRYSVELDEDKLILRRKLAPHVEDIRSGEVILVLRRASASELGNL